MIFCLCVAKEAAMTTKEFMLLAIEANNPCSLKHIIWECKDQGFTKGFIQALQALKNDGLIRTIDDDGETIVELI